VAKTVGMEGVCDGSNEAPPDQGTVDGGSREWALGRPEQEQARRPPRPPDEVTHVCMVAPVAGGLDGPSRGPRLRELR